VCRDVESVYSTHILGLVEELHFSKRFLFYQKKIN
jgi:hypothetical protein